MILLTGGTGFIGSHVAVELLNCGHQIVVLDNLSNSTRRVVDRVEELGRKKITFIEGNVQNAALLNEVFSKYPINGVMHFAGLKAVGESKAAPLRYYLENVAGSCALLKAMHDFGIFKIVFSSSATVYNPSNLMPLSESSEVGDCSNPYGRTKAIVENILIDLTTADPRWSIAILRYFNPIGAHRSGLLGEEPQGIPNNLIPYINMVLRGDLEKLRIFGQDFDTHDGTGVRDYIHVEDLAVGHTKAYEYLNTHRGANVWNLGTGKGYSVMEVIQMFEKITGRSIPYEFSDRRDGDVAKCWANPQKALDELGWSATHDLEDMVRDAWRWAKFNVR